MKLWQARWLVLSILLGHAFGTSSAQDIKPEPIALRSSQFPVASAELDKLVTKQDNAALRRHAWLLWSGITADSTQQYQGQLLPIWETWLSQEEAALPPSVVESLGSKRVLRPLARPKQFDEIKKKPNKSPVATVAGSDSTRLLAFVKINPDSASFLSAPHVTPAAGGSAVSYTSRSDLTALNAYFDQQKTPVADRKIVDFPVAATDLKVVFLPVAATGLTAIPVWGGVAKSTFPAQPDMGTWTTCVAVDPSNTQSGSTSIGCNGKSISARIVPLKAFYWIQLDDAGAQSVNSVLGLTGADAVKSNDYEVVVAVHVTTKEIANWTWQTFWWQNGNDAPDGIPGGVADMPDATVVKGVWRNYAMCVSDSIVNPANDPKGKPVVCFNPYLELSQDDGIHSNCMACHARATLPKAQYPSTYLPNGWVDLSDKNIFGNRVKTDFVWAINVIAH